MFDVMLSLYAKLVNGAVVLDITNTLVREYNYILPILSFTTD